MALQSDIDRCLLPLCPLLQWFLFSLHSHRQQVLFLFGGSSDSVHFEEK